MFIDCVACNLASAGVDTNAHTKTTASTVHVGVERSVNAISDSNMNIINDMMISISSRDYSLFTVLEAR